MANKRPGYIRLSIKQAKFLLEQAEHADDMRCADTSTELEQINRTAQMRLLKIKIQNAEARS